MIPKGSCECTTAAETPVAGVLVRFDGASLQPGVVTRRARIQSSITTERGSWCEQAGGRLRAASLRKSGTRGTSETNSMAGRTLTSRIASDGSAILALDGLA